MILFKFKINVVTLADLLDDDRSKELLFSLQDFLPGWATNAYFDSLHGKKASEVVNICCHSR